LCQKSTCLEIGDVQSDSEDEDDGGENAAPASAAETNTAPATDPEFEGTPSGKFS